MGTQDFYPLHYSLFPVPCSRFPIPDSRFPTPDSRFPVPCSLLPNLLQKFSQNVIIKFFCVIIKYPWALKRSTVRASRQFLSATGWLWSPS
ncbi:MULTISPECIES: hypothetical protein [unclassified Moorena]|uniref:hypothetical protein n=1 Tax=unclassified Moorena TaxID=2683338 RepID=UPI0014005DA1|nr:MULTISPECIES: hypothetical protein [unclassified Moorena]NEO17482.1 hypothetical protein [Moorena sp. SIO3E8]NEQ04066.1 hypothetical protein [Moorena sp. SIO3F7]